MNLVEKHNRISGQVECPLEVCGQKCKAWLVSTAENFPQRCSATRCRCGVGRALGLSKVEVCQESTTEGKGPGEGRAGTRIGTVTGHRIQAGEGSS